MYHCKFLFIYFIYFVVVSCAHKNMYMYYRTTAPKWKFLNNIFENSVKNAIFNLLSERARRARMREERQWLMASGEFVPDELKMSFNKEEENKDSDTERRPASTRNKTTIEGEDIGLEDRDEDLYTGMFKGRDL